MKNVAKKKKRAHLLSLRKNEKKKTAWAYKRINRRVILSLPNSAKAIVQIFTAIERF